jgi:hypothetical protein
MAANGSFLAASWQLNGIGLAADGCGRGRKWQRIGSFLAAFWQQMAAARAIQR